MYQNTDNFFLKSRWIYPSLRGHFNQIKQNFEAGILNQQIFINRDENGKMPKILIVADPLDDVDDELMIKYFALNCNAIIKIILSGGNRTSEERFSYLKSLLPPQFYLCEFGQFRQNNYGGSLMFLEDSYTSVSYINEQFNIYINSGPCCEILVRNISMANSGIVIFVMNPNGNNLSATIDNAVSKTSHYYVGRPSYTEPSSLASNPSSAFPYFYENLLLNKNVFIEIIDTDNYLLDNCLFPNPNNPELSGSEYSSLFRYPRFKNYLIDSTVMCVSSVSPPQNIMVNRQNSRINSNFIPFTYQMYQMCHEEGMTKGYLKFVEYKDCYQYNLPFHGNELNYAAAITQFYCTEALGGRYKPTRFGIDYTIANDRENIGWLIPDCIDDFKRNIENLKYFIPSYSACGFLLGVFKYNQGKIIH